MIFPLPTGWYMGLPEEKGLDRSRQATQDEQGQPGEHIKPGGDPESIQDRSLVSAQAMWWPKSAVIQHWLVFSIDYK